MCSIEQCSRCRLDFDACGHYDHTDPAPCSHFVKPIDNSKMFARWYKFSGRIGRLEYILTLAIAVVLYFYIMIGVALILQANGIDIETDLGKYIYSIGCMIPSLYDV